MEAAWNSHTKRAGRSTGVTMLFPGSQTQTGTAMDRRAGLTCQAPALAQDTGHERTPETCKHSWTDSPRWPLHEVIWNISEDACFDVNRKSLPNCKALNRIFVRHHIASWADPNCTLCWNGQAVCRVHDCLENTMNSAQSGTLGIHELAAEDICGSKSKAGQARQIG